MMPPRAQLSTRTPCFILAKAAALTIPRVSSVMGMWTVMKWDSAYTSSTFSFKSTCKALARARERYGSYATTFMPKASARLATSLPMRPMPRMPSVLFNSSVPW